MSSKRIFIGSFIKHPALTDLFKKAQKLLDKTGRFKWTRTPDNFHITFHFFGEMPIDKIDRLQKVLAPVLQKKLEIETMVSGLAYFSKKSKPTVLYAKLAPNEAVNNLFLEIQDILYQHQFISEKYTRFTPHITMARIKKTDTGFYPKIDELQLSEPIRVSLSKVDIIESILSRDGALYVGL